MNDACRFSFYRQPSPPENPFPILSLDEDELVAAAVAALFVVSAMPNSTGSAMIITASSY